MEKMPKIKKAIASARRELKDGTKAAAVEDHLRSTLNVPDANNPDSPRMRDDYPDSLALLQHTYNNPRMPDSIRLRAAEQALPYEHARVAEKGKKESKKDRAKEIASGGTGEQPRKPKFATKNPPRLVGITGGKT